MFKLARPARPAHPEVRKQKQLKPFHLPRAKEGEEVILYVTSVKVESPKQYFIYDGVDFAKYWLPVEASQSSNADQMIAPMTPTRLLTERQAGAIWERAQERTFETPTSPNKDYDHQDKNSKLFIPGKTYKESDCIVFCKASEYNPTQDQLQEWEDFKEDPVIENLSEKIDKKVYEMQGRKRKK